eukprot:6103840-Prymnesium_polylepis.1
MHRTLTIRTIRCTRKRRGPGELRTKSGVSIASPNDPPVGLILTPLDLEHCETRSLEQNAVVRVGPRDVKPRVLSVWRVYQEERWKDTGGARPVLLEDDRRVALR